MTSLVLTEETSRTTIGDVLASATSPVIELKDESGRLVAKIVLNTAMPLAGERSLVEQAEAEIDDLRRRRRADPARDVTTQQLLSRVRHIAQE
jgi:hypothetical protein